MKILIIDDEPIHNFIATRLFRQIDPELKVIDFTDAFNALKEIPVVDPDFIFLDLNMPRMTGWAFLDKMEAAGLKYKVFILTSSVSSFDHEKAKTYANVVECLEKPVKKEKLIQCISM